MATRGLVGPSQLGQLQLGAGAGGTSAPSFFISPSAGHAAGTVAITATYSGAATSASNPFTISSGPASGISGYVQVNGSIATFNLAVTAISSTLIVIADSVTGNTQSYNPAAVVPGAPTGVTATPGNAQASVAFTAPSDNGGSAITGFLLSWLGGSQSGASSPIVATGLTNGTSVAFTVHANNLVGSGPESSASSPVTPTGPSTGTSLQQIGPFLSTDTLVAPGYQIYSGAGTLLNALTTAGIATITGVSNGRLADMSLTSTDGLGGFCGYALWQTGQATNVYAPREVYLPPTSAPGSTGKVTKVVVFPFGTAMTSPGYQLFKSVAGTYTAIGSRVTAGVTSIPNIATARSVELTLTLAADKSFKGIIVWDNGAGVVAVPDEVFIPPVAAGGFVQPTPTKTAAVTLVDTAGALRPSLTGLKWAFFDQTNPASFLQPVDQGTGATTNASGVLSLTVHTVLAAGGTGWLVVTDSDGTTGQSPVAKAFSGPVAVA